MASGTIERSRLMRKVGIGVIGCGVISTAYLKAAQRFADLELRAVADMRSAAAEKRGAEFGVPAMRVDQLLKRDDVEIVVNLTVPLAHTDVSLAVLQRRQARPFREAARRERGRGAQGDGPRREKDLRVGCAPDTFLGGGHQTARKLIDDGAIGTPVAGTRLLHVPRPRALASGARLLLSARRRADARHGPLLHHQPDPAARARSPASWARSRSRGSSAWSPASR